MTELARRLGLHKSTASRLLATLQKRGLVEQDDETGKYRLGPGRHPPGRAGRADARPARDRAARARAAGRLTHETTGLGHPRRRHVAGRRPGRRPEPHRRRRLDRAGDAAPLRRLGQGPAVVARRARGPADRPARPRHLHGADDRRARAAARGAGPDPAARLRDRDRRVRAGAQRGRGAGPRRPRQRDRRRRHLGPGLPARRRAGSRSWPPRPARPPRPSRSGSAAPPPDQRRTARSAGVTACTPRLPRLRQTKPWSDIVPFVAARSCRSCSSSSPRSSRCGSPGCSSTASSRRCSIARRPRARPRS